MVVRWGGKAFLLMLPETTLEEGLVMAERIRNAVAAEPVLAEGRNCVRTRT